MAGRPYRKPTLARARVGANFRLMGRPGWESAAIGMVLALAQAAPARAEEPALPVVAAPSPTRTTLPPVPELRLQWPIVPLKFTFTGTEEGSYRNGPLRLFRAESLWLRTPSVQLLTATSAERAFELDCSVTCQPVAMRGLGLEARFLLPDAMPLVSQPHLVVRQSTMRQPLSARAVGTLHVGVGGFLNF